VPFNALMVDFVPEALRGRASGVNGAMSHVGNFVGAIGGLSYSSLGVGPLVMVMGMALMSGMALTASAVAESGTTLMSQPLAHVNTEPEEERESLSGPPDVESSRRLDVGGPGQVLNSMLLPLRDHDFFWVFVTRFLMQQGVYTVQEFLQFFMADAVALPVGMAAETAVSLTMLALMAAAISSAAAAGVISDRIGGKRKMLVYQAGATMASSTCAMLLWPGFSWILFTACLFGLGYGTFLAIDFALVMDVLPNKEDAAKDLAVYHAALVLPQVLATPLAGTVLDIFQSEKQPGNPAGTHARGYQIVFMMAAAYFVLATFLIKKVRKVS